jgi:hypothetical protein
VSVDVKHSHDDVMMKDISHHHHHHHHRSAGRMSGKHRPALTMSFIFSADGHTLGDYYSNRRVMKRTGMPAGDDMSGRQRTCAPTIGVNSPGVNSWGSSWGSSWAGIWKPTRAGIFSFYVFISRARDGFQGTRVHIHTMHIHTHTHTHTHTLSHTHSSYTLGCSVHPCMITGNLS